MKIYKNLDINDLESEIWKVIEDFPDYQVSNFGRVKSFKKWNGTNKRILKQYEVNGYLYINLSKNGKSKRKLIHRIIYETFKEKLKDGYDIHHIDKNKENNFVDNLESKEYKKHRGEHSKINNIGNKNMSGKHPSIKTRKIMSEKNPRKFSNQKYIDIKIDIEKEELTHREIAKKHGISISMVSYIRNGKRGNL